MGYNATDWEVCPDPAGKGRGWTATRALEDERGSLEEWIGEFWATAAQARAAVAETVRLEKDGRRLRAALMYLTCALEVAHDAGGGTPDMREAVIIAMAKARTVLNATEESKPKAGDLARNLAGAEWSAVLADTFTRHLEAELSATDYLEVCRRNAAEPDPLVCASHDFLDANEIMAEAWGKCVLSHGFPEFDLQDDAHRALWSRAWAEAKRDYLMD